MITNGHIQLYPIFRIAIFLIGGIILGDVFYGTVSPRIWFCAVILSFAVTLMLYRYCVAQTVAIYIVFLLTGAFLTSRELTFINTELPDGKTDFEAVVISPPVITGKVVRCDMLVSSVHPTIKIKASIYRDGRADNLKVGQGIVANAKLEKPRNYIKSDFDYKKYLTNHGFSATAFMYTDEWRQATVGFDNLSRLDKIRILALRYRERLLEQFRLLGIDGQTYAVLSAMTLGERVNMSKEITNDYSVSGALHVLSLSGLHLSIIYAMLMILCLRRRRSVIAQILVICSIWIYTFIAGLPVSAVRSAVMLTIYSFVSLLNRDRMSVNVLAVSAVAILLVNPLNLYDIGFQMSFLSVLFILLFYRPIYNIMPEAVTEFIVFKWLWGMTAVSLAAQLGVAPLVALYFHRFSCYFLLTNFFVIPISTTILYGTVAVFMLSWYPLLQSIVSDGLIFVVGLMNKWVSYIASLPGASIENIYISSLQAMLIYVIIVSCFIIIKYLRRMVWKG